LQDFVIHLADGNDQFIGENNSQGDGDVGYRLIALVAWDAKIRISTVPRPCGLLVQVEDR
jgi:hypothetical protein